jgi:hypothetical protein
MLLLSGIITAAGLFEVETDHPTVQQLYHCNFRKIEHTLLEMM